MSTTGNAWHPTWMTAGPQSCEVISFGLNCSQLHLQFCILMRLIPLKIYLKLKVCILFSWRIVGYGHCIYKLEWMVY